MGADLVVRNARLVLPETGPMEAGLVVRDGRIVELVSSHEEPPAAEILDAKGRVVLPGLIDPHIHYGWVPPLEERIRAESAFGVSGGVTHLYPVYPSSRVIPRTDGRADRPGQSTSLPGLRRSSDPFQQGPGSRARSICRTLWRHLIQNLHEYEGTPRHWRPHGPPSGIRPCGSTRCRL